MDSGDTTPRNPSIPAAVEPASDEHDLHLAHISHPSCWCHPVEVEPGVWLHHRVSQVQASDEIDPMLEIYVADIKGHIEGDDGSGTL